MKSKVQLALASRSTKMVERVGDHIQLPSPYNQFWYVTPFVGSSWGTKYSSILNLAYGGLNGNVLILVLGLTVGYDHIMIGGWQGLVTLVAPQVWSDLGEVR